MPQCTTCPNNNNSVQGHHVFPLSYGGKKSGETANICSNCHILVHQCIENPELVPPPSMRQIVTKGRLAKRLHSEGKLEARDRRPTLLVATTKQDEEVLSYLKVVLNAKSRSETVIKALHFTARNIKRVRT